MIDQIFDLLGKNPTLSLYILGAIIIVILIVYKSLIMDIVKAYIKKRYTLFDENEIREAVSKASEEREFYTKTTEKLTPSVEDRIIRHLKNNLKK